MSFLRKARNGFTLIEVMVSLVIFIVMTTLLVAKYGNFNQSVLLTNLGYDIALTLRTAQTYGLSVQAQQVTPTPSGTVSPTAVPVFQYPYGVAFCKIADCGNGLTNQKIILFADTSTAAPGAYDSADIVVSTYSIKRGATIMGFCVIDNPGSCTPTDGTTNRLDITFNRPNPDAIICNSSDSGGVGRACAKLSGTQAPIAYAKILIQASDGSLRSVVVRKTGQISVEN